MYRYLLWYYIVKAQVTFIFKTRYFFSATLAGWPPWGTNFNYSEHPTNKSVIVFHRVLKLNLKRFYKRKLIKTGD
jgi:hypothetical protein